MVIDSPRATSGRTRLSPRRARAAGGWIRRAAALAVLAVGIACLPGAAAAQGPQWMPGFPLRAGNAVILMWSPVPGATEYVVLRKTVGGAFATVYKGAQPYYNDTAAPAAEQLTYVVVATTGGTESGRSAERSVPRVAPPKPPVAVGVVASEKAVSLKWTVSPDAAFSKVYRAENGNGPWTLLASGAFDTFVDRTVEPGKTYYYRFSSVDRYGAESEKSEPVAGKPSAAAEAAPTTGAALRRVARTGEFSGEKHYPLDQPGDILISRSGEVFVLDRHSVQVFGADGEFLRRIPLDRSWGLAGGMIFDAEGNLLLCFFAEQVVRRVDPSGKLIQEIRDPFCREQNPVNPNDVALDADGNFWIVDGKHSRILKADRTCSALDIVRRKAGKPLPPTIPEYGFPAPKKIYFNRHDGRIYVILGARAEIVAIDPKTARVVATFGGLGTAPDKFSGIGGLSFLKNGNILVLDQFKQLIKEFDAGYRHVATYADIFDKKVPQLSADLATTFAYREDMRRFYITSNLLNRVYIYDVAD